MTVLRWYARLLRRSVDRETGFWRMWRARVAFVTALYALSLLLLVGLVLVWPS